MFFVPELPVPPSEYRAMFANSASSGLKGGMGGGGGGDGGGDGGDGDGGDDGGDGGDGGGDGGGGGWNCTTKDSFAVLAKKTLGGKGFAIKKLCPKPGAAHSAPFQPSPNESVMSRVHVAPSATANGALEVFPYGAPPLSVVPSEQARLQPTSSGYVPPEQVIAEETIEGGDDGGDGGDNGGDGGGDGGDGGGDGSGDDGGGGDGGGDGGGNGHEVKSLGHAVCCGSTELPYGMQITPGAPFAYSCLMHAEVAAGLTPR